MPLFLHNSCINDRGKVVHLWNGCGLNKHLDPVTCGHIRIFKAQTHACNCASAVVAAVNGKGYVAVIHFYFLFK